MLVCDGGAINNNKKQGFSSHCQQPVVAPHTDKHDRVFVFPCCPSRRLPIQIVIPAKEQLYIFTQRGGSLLKERE